MTSKFESIIWKCINDGIFIPEYTFYFQKKYKKIQIATINETMKKISEDHVSVSRFGDGEFAWMANTHQEKKSFQNYSPELSARLKEVIESDKEDLIVCLPQAFLNPKVLTAHKFWEREMGKHGSKWLPYISTSKQYYNTSITRPYIDFKNKEKNTDVFTEFKKLWRNKKVLIVEGNGTKFGVGNNLLEDASQIKRIEAPTTNAFKFYPHILEATKDAMKQYQPNIVLCALGPTATILAYDLADFEGSQVIDIGHLDIEYEWYLRGANKRELIPGKYVNEVPGHEKEDSKKLLETKKYENQIVSRIN